MTLVSDKLPRHIAIIMDGNGRWAKSRGLSSVAGHQKGALRVKDITEHLALLGVEYLSLFAFSTENWTRPAEEVDALMKLLLSFLNDQLEDMNKNNIKLDFAGRRDRFSAEVLNTLEKTRQRTEANTGLNLILCIDYGGRQELVEAASKKDTFKSEQELSDSLYLPELPDVDLMIRTSGEERISNFMLWQLSYAELYFSDILWPDFDAEQMDIALRSYALRNRRFGARM